MPTAVTVAARDAPATPAALQSLARSYKPLEFFRPLQVADAALRASSLASVVDRLAHVARTDRAGLAVLLPTAQRLALEW